MKFQNTLLIIIFSLLVFATKIYAEDISDAQWKENVNQKLDLLIKESQEKDRKIELLTQENEKNSLGLSIPKVYESQYGFAPAASKIYHVPSGVSIGGYGELIYNQFQSDKDDGTASGRTDQIDFVRNILYVGYKYNEKVLFNSEIEFEHASTTNGGSRGEVSVEFAHLDFALLQNEEKDTTLGARAGLVLVPVGIHNELHEPTQFHGTARPSTENNIIPTTWRDNGVGIFGTVGPVEYRTYVLAGLQGIRSSDGFGGFSSSGLRGGRSKGSKSKAADKAWVGRVDVTPISGIKVGASLYNGNTAQDTPDSNGSEFDGTVTLWEVHGQTEYKGAELKALYTKANLTNVTQLNAANSLTGSNSIGQEMFGGYIEVAFNIFSLFDCTHYLAPFFRYERMDTQQNVPTGFSEKGSTDVTEYTYGLSYKPHPNIIIKADVQNQNNKAGTGIDSANAGIGYLF